MLSIFYFLSPSIPYHPYPSSYSPSLSFSAPILAMLALNLNSHSLRLAHTIAAVLGDLARPSFGSFL